MLRNSILIALIFPCILFGQNLVKNPSFEDLKKCSYYIGGFDRGVENWKSATFGSTDLFNSCSDQIANKVPQNYIGRQFPKQGENYAGCYFYSDKNYREYIQGELTERLVKGEKYKVSFYISLADNADFAIRDIDFLLSENNFTILFDKNLSNSRLKKVKGKFELYDVGNTSYYQNKNGWHKITKEIQATGFEKFITIGNFKNNVSTKKIKAAYKIKQGVSYYYIDMVSVALINDSVVKNEITKNEEAEESTHPKIEPLKLNSPYVLKDVLFEFGSDVLLADSKENLNELYKYLEGSSLFVTINGYTDNVGDDKSNIELSKSRAKAVVNYLANLGISSKRLYFEGYGKANSLTSNDTEEDRQKNRRVEFVLSNKKPIN